ncbi:MAG: tRNA pseudouridine(13) synthase TruD [Phycisphaerales bacterium]|jgi:tRNA pseudouridine13 synthase|nr:tRNA pseudouridine(13) synthase TruD [Phycisphaeraceae bacterium]
MTIRRQPEDFVVIERLLASAMAGWRDAPGEETPHAVYRLEKRSLTTPEAVSHLAKALGTRAGLIEHGGLKDKHACTTQHVSLRPEQAGRVRSLSAKVQGQGWSAERIGWSGRALDASMIEGNEFVIVVRDLRPADVDTLNARADLLNIGPSRSEATLRIVNYFGAQRFGSARHGQGFVARALIAGEFERALRLSIATPARKDMGRQREFTRAAATKWGQWEVLARELPAMPERRAIEVLARGGAMWEAYAALPHALTQMHVEAFQSHLWNATARRMVEAHAASMKPVEGKAEAFLRADDEFGEMLFLSAADVPEAWNGLEVPTLSPEVRLAGCSSAWHAAAVAALRDEGLADTGELRIEHVRRPTFGSANRPLLTLARGFAMSPPERDELGSARAGKRTLRFALPRGSYATVVLRALGQ